MSTVVNFDQVAANEANRASQAGASERKTVSPGIDVFDIEKAEVKQSQNGSEYIEVKFVNADDKYLTERFFTTEKAISRVFELSKNAGVELSGEVSMDDVASSLIGNRIGLIVGADKENANIDGKDLVVTRSKLKNFRGFSFTPDQLEANKNAKIVIEDKTAISIDATEAPTDSLPF